MFMNRYLSVFMNNLKRCVIFKLFKGTVSDISSVLPCKEENVYFIMITLETFTFPFQLRFSIFPCTKQIIAYDLFFFIRPVQKRFGYSS